MNCNEINDMMSLYIDGELLDDEKLFFENHIKLCSKCKKEFDSYKDFVTALQNIKGEEPPKGYCDRLHRKLIASKSKNRLSRIIWIKYGSIAAALIIVFSIIASIPNIFRKYDMSKSENSIMYDSAAPAEAPEINMEYGMASQVEEYSGSGENYQIYDAKEEPTMRSATLENREMKIIKTGTIAVQTEDYDKFLNDIAKKINDIGGYIEKNNTQVRHYDSRELKYGNLTIRVPQENFYDFVKFLEGSSKVQNKNILETDVTKEYYEKDNRVKNLEIQEEHLRQLFDKANTVEEMLQIENELRRIRTEIDALNINLSDIDDRASMSIIDLEVNEVIKANLMTSRENVWDRARDGFINTINGLVQLGENIIVWLISISPILIPLVIIIIIIIMQVRKRMNN